MTDLFYREVFRQWRLVKIFLAGDTPSVKHDLHPALFWTERGRDTSLPDHVYTLAQSATTGGWSTWLEVVTGSLRTISDRYLERFGATHITVSHHQFGEWQSLLPEIPSLAVVAWRLREEFSPPPINGRTLPELQKYIEKKIRPQVAKSSLPTIRELRLDRLIAEHGLDDLHVHLNGSSEAEWVWLDAMKSLDDFGRNFRCMSKEVYEHLEQVEPGLRPNDFIARLRVAQRVHRLLARVALNIFPKELEMEEINLASFFVCNQHLFDSEGINPVLQWNLSTNSHPIAALEPWFKQETDITLETLLFILLLQKLMDGNFPRREEIAALFYFYLSVFCQFRRMLIQQRNQIGFDQFQKITLNEMRWNLEKNNYLLRFRQSQYTEAGDMDVLEGRLAPKATIADLNRLMKTIAKGYHDYKGLRDTKECHCQKNAALVPEPMRIDPPPERKLELRLVVHFIKKNDSSKGEIPTCRHYRLRKDLRRHALVAHFVSQRRKEPPYIVGFDAASNELQAPPEVFAPVYRLLRAKGWRQFTFHVGEDYHHLLSGMRAIYEAIDFLQLKRGNRLGHATAIGIDPKLWQSRISSMMTLPAQEWLDNLLFLYGMAKQANIALDPIAIEMDIRRLGQLIYEEQHEPYMLYQAWKMRFLDPIAALNLDGQKNDTINPFRLTEFELVEDNKKENPTALKLFQDYHQLGSIKNEQEKKYITVILKLENKPTSRSDYSAKTDYYFDPLDAAGLYDLQEWMLRLVRERGLILESLPTSNVRISFYRSLQEHHIFRWLGITSQGEKPIVVLGSDDPGIFATNMRNEYAHLFLELEKLSPGNAKEYLEQLIDNGKAFRFQVDYSKYL